MTLVSALADCWLGLCRRTPAFRASPTGNPAHHEFSYEGRPDGGSGGPETIRRGAGAILSGTRTLIRNRHLFWFTFLAGLVLAGHILAQGVLLYAGDEGGHVLILSPVVTFVLEFPTVFCLLFLIAGLVLSLSSDKEEPVPYLHALTKVKPFLGSLLLWSVILALAGSLLFTTGLHLTMLNPAWYRPFNIFGALSGFLSVVLAQFPFSWSLEPDAYFPSGRVFALFGATLKLALLYSLILSVVNVLLFVLTLFVVPNIVLEKKRLKDAVSGSFGMIWKSRGEIATFLLGLGIVIFAASLTFLLFQFTGIDQVSTGPYNTSISSTNPGMAWIAFGLLYILALSGFAFVVATVGGIATLDLYQYARGRGTVK